MKQAETQGTGKEATAAIPVHRHVVAMEILREKQQPSRASRGGGPPSGASRRVSPCEECSISWSEYYLG